MNEKHNLQSSEENAREALKLHALSSKPYDDACILLRELRLLIDSPKLDKAITLLEESGAPFEALKERLHNMLHDNVSSSDTCASGKNVKAYAWRTGIIGFGDNVPEGALLIASGPNDDVKDAVESTARLAYDNITWLVPGIPESGDENEKIDALMAYEKEVRNRLDMNTSSPAS